MRNTVRILSTLTVGAVVGLAVHTPVSAQGTRLLSAPAMAAAEQLEAQSAQQKFTSHDWIMAGQTLERAAQLRPADDLQGINDLFEAATAYTTAGRSTMSLQALQNATNRAEAAGRSDLAATALFAAFNIAARLQDDDMISRYLDQLVTVVQSPGATQAQRDAVLGPRGLEEVYGS